VGTNSGQETLYKPLDTGSETPVEKVTVKSVWSDASTPPVGSESPYFDETFEIEGIVGEVVPTSTQFYAKQITQRTRIRKYAYNSEGNQEIDLIEVSFPRGLINPDDSDPLTLIESRTTTITRTYDSNSRLIQIVTDVQEAKGLVNKAEANDFFQPTTALIETTANTFEAAEGELETDQMSKQVVTKQQPKILTNPDEVTNPYEVHTAEKITRQWSRIGETEQFGFVESPQKAKILVNQNETADPYSLTFAPGGEVGASSVIAINHHRLSIAPRTATLPRPKLRQWFTLTSALAMRENEFIRSRMCRITIPPGRSPSDWVNGWQQHGMPMRLGLL
jgi:hypothetical protein